MPKCCVRQASVGPPGGHCGSKPVSKEMLSRLGPRKQGHEPPLERAEPFDSGILSPANGVVTTVPSPSLKNGESSVFFFECVFAAVFVDLAGFREVLGLAG